FTDTLFYDTNGNGVYDQGEATPGIAVRLLVGNSTAASYDVSTSVGSFAVPVQSIAAGATVQVVLSNTTTASVSLTIPRDYTNYNAFSLAPNESRLYGTFVRAVTAQNVGFRNLSVSQSPLVSAPLSISLTKTNIQLRSPSIVGLQY